MSIPNTADPAFLDDSGYTDALLKADLPVCVHYGVELHKAAIQKDAAGESEQAAVLAVLRAVCSLRLDDTPGTPALVSMTPSSAVYKTPTIDTFTTGHLDFFETIRVNLQDAELRARLGDIVWERRHGATPYKAGIDAVDHYIQSAKRLAAAEQWGHVNERLLRAAQLGAHLSYKQGVDTTKSTVRHFLDEQGETAPAYQLWALSFLLQWGGDDSNILAAYTVKAATEAEAEEHWHRTRQLWEIAAGWIDASGSSYQAADGGPSTRDEALVRAAEVHVLQAQAMSTTDGGPLAAPFQLKAAIKKLRNVGGQKERIDQLHTELLASNSKIIALLQPVSVEGTPVGDATAAALDLAENQARQAVEGKSLPEALFILASMIRPRPVDERKRQAESTISGSITHALMPSTFVNAAGKTVARQPSSLSISEEEREAYILAEMFRQSTIYYGLVAAGRIDPARQQILQNHAPSFADLYNLLAPSGWIPVGRERTFIRGLHAGLYGDFLVAAHLLIPQIEHSIRALMETHGYIISGLDDRGIQDEHNINALLYRTELIEILGEDIVFDLKALLISRFAFNFRNRVSHGLMHDSNFSAEAFVYLWGLCLRLTCIPLQSLDKM